MDLLQTLRVRRSPALETLADPGPTPGQLDDILTLAARVPDHGKLVPWRFVVIEGEARSAMGAAVSGWWADDNGHLAAKDRAAFDKGVRQWGARFGAPVVVAVVSRARSHPKIPEWEQVLSAGACCMSLILAARGHGFGAVWISEWYAYDDRARAWLGLAVDEKIAGFIHLGTPTAAREDRERPDLRAIVSRPPGAR